jgi:phosphate acyltransferase
MRIVLDAMGSDVGATPLVEGAVLAAKRFDCEILLAGRQYTLGRLLRHFRYRGDQIEIVPCSQAVRMGESPADSLRKKGSSIAVAARLVREGRADALVSAGNTGSSLAHSLKAWGRLKGIKRPGIANLIPTPVHPCLLLDLGATVDCKPRNLFDFAVMGAVYSRCVLGRSEPRVGLLSNGEERSKGNAVTLATRDLLEASHLNFVGNVEGNEIFQSKADVVVCDGFVGNIALKVCEGVGRMVMSGIKGAMKRNVFSLAGAMMMSPGMRPLKKKMDSSEYGGAPLLGLNGICIISHGSSDARAVMNAIRVAIESVEQNVNANIQKELQLINSETDMDS